MLILNANLLIIDPSSSTNAFDNQINIFHIILPNPTIGMCKDINMLHGVKGYF